MATLPFIDVGDSQGSVDWVRARKDGKAAIAACKATEGEDFRAKTFSAARVKSIRKQIGWPIKGDGTRTPDTAQAIKDFQARLPRRPARDGASLEDGLVGQTEEALRSSAANGGSCSKNSLFQELPPPSRLDPHAPGTGVRPGKLGITSVARSGSCRFPRLRPRRVDEPAQVRQRDRSDEASPLLGGRGAQGLLRSAISRRRVSSATSMSATSARTPPAAQRPGRRSSSTRSDGNNRAGLCVYLDGCGRSSSVSRR
jgi:hypothetical protein